MIRSSIDLGTNTCLLLVVDWDREKNQIRKVLGDFSTQVRLGEKVDRDRKFRPEAMLRTLACLEAYAKKLISLGGDPRDTLCVATSQARGAQNSQEYFAQIQSKLGFSFQVISGEQEAQATFLGALLPGMSPGSSYVIDIGGGSTEIISKNHKVSVDMGAVRFTERFLLSDPVTEIEFARCQAEIDRLLEASGFSGVDPSSVLVAVAGTATTLASWHLGLSAFVPEKINFAVLTRQNLEKFVNELKRQTLQERRESLGFEASRADVILAGALILWRAVEKLGFQQCQVSIQGLRYGVLLSESLKTQGR